MNDIVGPPQRPNRSVHGKTLPSIKTETPAPEPFKTPDEVAAEDELRVPLEEEQTEMSDNQTKVPKSGRFKLGWPPGNKEFLLAGLVIVLIAGGISYAVMQNHKVVTPKAAKKVVIVKPKTVPSTLSGLPVDPKINQTMVTGVMIENSQDARPQSGLSQASVVFEAIAEGGITRFLALFQDTSPDNVGPIRSARPYYVQWAMGFDAGYAHVGGSPEALSDIKAWGVKDLDQFANGGSYHRVASRPAPHNVYTPIATLNQLETSKGYMVSTYKGFVRKKKEAPLKVPTAKTIDMKLSGPLYNTHYDYVAATNSYNRSEAGAPHIDANTNKQISPKVVIALIMPYSLAADAHHSEYQNIGTGQAYIFQDGGVSIGTWTKTDNASQITFTDAAGKPLGLNPGQTWLTALGSSGSVTYTP